MTPADCVPALRVPALRVPALAKAVTTLGLILSCSAYLNPPMDAQPAVDCSKVPHDDGALAWEASYDGPIPNVIPALPPREQPPPPPQSDAAVANDYPPTDRIPTAPQSTAPIAVQPDGASAVAMTAIPDVIPALPTALVTTRTGHQLLAINPQAQPYKVNIPRQYVACGDEYVSQIRICVSEVGIVSSVKILRPSIPVIDLQLPVVIHRWRYHPYQVDGRATAFCYPMNYRVRP